MQYPPVNQTLLLFDLDGTLVNSEAMILAAQAQAFAALGLPMPSRERALSIVGLSLTEAFTVLVGPEGPVDALVDVYGQTFKRQREEAKIPEPLFDGVEDVLARAFAAGHLALGIATGKSRRGVNALIGKHGWEPYFATIQTADDAPSKPHPAMVLQACAATGHAPERAIMIGDSSYDMAMACAAGARAIGVAWGFQPREALISAGAEVIAENFPHLEALITEFAA
ncbi:MAG: phosphoglycolate [Beijerinckiaceae bacterium]|nr:MAG: phosphoglycolate [Beijerinckiaceae bacterium]